MLNIIFTEDSGRITRVKTTPEEFALLPEGVRYFDPELELSVVKTFDKLKSISVAVEVDDRMKAISSGFQAQKSDKSKLNRNNRSAAWTV